MFHIFKQAHSVKNKLNKDYVQDRPDTCKRLALNLPIHITVSRGMKTNNISISHYLLTVDAFYLIKINIAFDKPIKKKF